MPTDTQSEVNNTRSEVIDLFHPLYLHPYDTPGTLLVTIPFRRVETRDAYFSFCKQQNSDHRW